MGFTSVFKVLNRVAGRHTYDNGCTKLAWYVTQFYGDLDIIFVRTIPGKMIMSKLCAKFVSINICSFIFGSFDVKLIIELPFLICQRHYVAGDIRTAYWNSACDSYSNNITNINGWTESSKADVKTGMPLTWVNALYAPQSHAWSVSAPWSDQPVYWNHLFLLRLENCIAYGLH